MTIPNTELVDPLGDDWDADHVISLADGGTNAFPDNWQTLCSWCHDAKTYGKDITHGCRV